MIYLLGKYSKIVRWWWFKKTGDWQWGLIRWLVECSARDNHEGLRIITNQALDMHHRGLRHTMLTESRFRHFMKTVNSK